MTSENKRFKESLKEISNALNEQDPWGLVEKERPLFTKSLEWDIGVDWMRKKIEDFSYAEKLYNALCNNTWENVETKDQYYCSWRYAGGIVAHNRRFPSDYLDFYCSGNEGDIDSEIAEDFAKLGWLCIKETPDLSESNQADLQESAELIQEINKDK